MDVEQESTLENDASASSAQARLHESESESDSGADQQESNTSEQQPQKEKRRRGIHQNKKRARLERLAAKRKAGKQGNEQLEASNQPEGDKSNYTAIVMENPDFEWYYKISGIIPEEEFEAFMKTCRIVLPSTFRITGSNKSFALALRETLETRYFSQMESITNSDAELIEKPTPVTFYPDNLAWQYKASRATIRKLPSLNNFHKFLVQETAAGNISRQEAVSMIPPLLMDVQPHHYALDMCAAPGSKTAQLIESLHSQMDSDNKKVPTGFVLANDSDNKRCYLLVHQTKRLQSPCTLVTNLDASRFPHIELCDPESGNSKPIFFDRILCDVPCSGDGTIRKNPLVWNNWKLQDSGNMHRLQVPILRRAIQLLKVGGSMVYSTCSMHPVEDEAVVATILQENNGAVELVDISHELPKLKRYNGVKHWVVTDRERNIYKSFEEVKSSSNKAAQLIRPSFFPPDPETADALHLERCIRILPHLQDTGGFFVAVLRKVRPANRKDNLANATSSSTPSSTSSATETNDSISVQAEASTVDTLNSVDNISNANDNETERVIANIGSAKPKASRPRGTYKEEPIIFLDFNKDSDTITELKRCIGESENFPMNSLFSRNSEKKRVVYMVTPTVISILKAKNVEALNIINTGIKAFIKSEFTYGRSSTNYRFSNEGLGVIAPLAPTRTVTISYAEFLMLLQEKQPKLSRFTPSVRNRLEEMLTVDKIQSMIFCFDARLQPELNLPFTQPIYACAWMHATSIMLMLSKEDKSSMLAILGEESLEEKEESSAKASEAYVADALSSTTSLEAATSLSSDSVSTANMV